MLKRFRGSLSAALLSTFPDHPWQRWRFNNASRQLFYSALLNPTELRQYFDSMGKRLGIKTPTDWCRVSADQLDWALDGHFKSRSALLQSLQLAYPEVEFDPDKFNAGSPVHRLIELTAIMLPVKRSNNVS